ncbi:MAG: hypothetical protein ABIA74_04510 [bacterium]
MEIRKNILYVLTTFLILSNFLSVQSLDIGEYEEGALKKASIKRKAVTPTPDILSYGSILRFKNENTATFIGLEGSSVGGKEDSTLDTYWYIYPENIEDKDLKNKYAIKNGATVRIVNVVTNKELEGHTWILEAIGSIEYYLKKDNRLVFKNPDDGTYLTGSLDISGNTSLYKLTTQTKLSGYSYWSIADFYPSYLESDFKSGDIVAIKCLFNDKFLTFFQDRIEVISVRNFPNPPDKIFFQNLASPMRDNTDNDESKFQFVREKGSIGFKSLAPTGKDHFIRANNTKDVGHDRAFMQGQKEYFYNRGLVQIWSKTLGEWERFKPEHFHIKGLGSNGYLAYLYTISKYLESLGNRGRSVTRNDSPIHNGIETDAVILSTYDNVYFSEGKPNKKTPKGLFAIIKISGDPIMPIIPEEEIIEGPIEEPEIKLEKALMGKYENWKEITQQGLADVIFEAKALDNIMIGLAPEAKDYKKDEKIYEVVIGGGVGNEANTYSLIRNTHMGKASDPKIGTYKMGKDIPNKDWNSYWVRIIDQKISFGSGRTPGENMILEWTDPTEPGILVKYIGLSNYKDPVYFKNIEYLTPEVEEEVKAEFFTDKLKNARSIKIFKDMIDKYISLIPEAGESESKTKVFFDEIIWLSQNTPKGKEVELQRLVESVRWNPKLVRPTTENIINYLTIEAGTPMSFDKKIATFEGLINQAYTDEQVKAFLTDNREDIVSLLKILAEEGIESSPANMKRVQGVIETLVYDPIFADYVTLLESIASELTKPITVETLLERIASESATADEPTEIRFIKTTTNLLQKEFGPLIEEVKTGAISEESKQKIINLEKLLNSIIYGIEFEGLHKNIAKEWLARLPKTTAGLIIVETPGESATNEEKVNYLIAATTNETLKSAEKKKIFFEIISQLVKDKNLPADLIEKVRTVLGIIKWHPDVNDQEDALVKYYETQISIPVTIDDQINDLLNRILTITDEAGKKTFLTKVDKVIEATEKDINESKKVTSLPKLQTLLKTMLSLPNFVSDKDAINAKLTKVAELIQRNAGVTTATTTTQATTTTPQRTTPSTRITTVPQTTIRGRAIIPTRPSVATSMPAA